ncbi:hypothetical protein [uncultured Clostridium sp.]|uniref:hypothetical protein n=1 Tax=uncultured Clostridium sp. TaxID=59620 RepID=UPI0027DCFB6E|nr:hypothetical protein [uncultured Clostridium sp.]
MDLKDIKTLRQVSKEYNIPITTLQSRLIYLIENVDYKKLGAGQGTILSPEGIEKIIQYKYIRKIENQPTR